MRGNVGSSKRDSLNWLRITFGKNVEFKKYSHGVSDAGTRLLFKVTPNMNNIYSTYMGHTRVTHDLQLKE